MNEMVAIFSHVQQRQSPATVLPPHQGNPQCFHSNPPPKAQVVQYGEDRMLSTLHSAKVPNLIYEEDDLRKKEKYGVLESEDSLIEVLEEEASLEDDLMTGMGQASDSQAEDSDMEDDLGEEDAETEAFSTLGGEIYEEACRIVDEIEANLSADLSEEILKKSLLQLGKGQRNR